MISMIHGTLADIGAGRFCCCKLYRRQQGGRHCTRSDGRGNCSKCMGLRARSDVRRA
jgi:hypothetical protein